MPSLVFVQLLLPLPWDGMVPITLGEMMRYQQVLQTQDADYLKAITAPNTS